MLGVAPRDSRCSRLRSDSPQDFAEWPRWLRCAPGAELLAPRVAMRRPVRLLVALSSMASNPNMLT